MNIHFFERRTLLSATLCSDSVNKTWPGCFHDFFLFCYLLINIPQDRQVKVIYMSQKKSLQYGLKSTRYFGAKLWNALPVELRNAPSKILFKKILKIHLLNKVDR